MKDFNQLITRYRQFGGIRLVWQYAKMGVLSTGVKEIVKCTIKGRSFKSIYPIITERIDEQLVAKYGHITHRKDNRVKVKDCGNEYVWFCWLQGIDNAPDMVKVCLVSQRRMFGNNVVVLDAENYRQWVTLPTFIEGKYRKGYIPGALFSDLLRLELLIQYGGTWIDSSVLVNPTRLREEDALWKPTMEQLMNSELFIFRYLRKGKVVGISNWLIHAKAGNPLLMDLREMLLAYWRDYNCTVEYYIFHLFFSVVAKRYPEMIAQMPRGNSYHSIMLGSQLDKDFNEEWWKELTEHVCFHKMNYRKENLAKANPNCYWNHILDNEDKWHSNTLSKHGTI